jgi:hypothetical protein
MVLVDMQIALGVQLDIHKAVLGKLLQHMVEKADPRGDAGRAGTVEIDGGADAGLLGGAVDLGAAHETTASSGSVAEQRCEAGFLSGRGRQRQLCDALGRRRGRSRSLNPRPLSLMSREHDQT